MLDEARRLALVQSARAVVQYRTPPIWRFTHEKQILLLNVYPLGAGQIYTIETDLMELFGEEKGEPQFGILPMQVDLSKIWEFDPWQASSNDEAEDDTNAWKVIDWEQERDDISGRW